MLLGRGLFRERPGQHELGLEHRPGALDHAVEGGRHPADHRMPDPPLDVFDGLPGIALVPVPIEVLGDQAELDDEVAGEVLRLDLAALLPPEAEQGGFIVAHDDPGVRAADEGAAVNPINRSPAISDLANGAFGLATVQLRPGLIHANDGGRPHAPNCCVVAPLQGSSFANASIRCR